MNIFKSEVLHLVSQLSAKENTIGTYYNYITLSMNLKEESLILLLQLYNKRKDPHLESLLWKITIKKKVKVRFNIYNKTTLIK